MRRQSRLAYGLIAVFLALWGVSLGLPGIVFNTPDRLHENQSVGETTAFLEQGAECWTGTGIHLRLNRDHVLTDTRGTKFSDLGQQQIACRGLTTKTSYKGYRILIDGWLGAFFYIFAWYANVLALVALILALIGRAPKTAAWIAGGAFLLGLDAFRLDALPIIGICPCLPETVDHLAIGYYVWEFSILALLSSQFVTIKQRRAERGEEPAIS